MGWREWIGLETRSTGSYTDSIVRAIQAQASATVANDPQGIASLEIAAGLWSRGFASVTVAPDNLLTRALSPAVLSSIGRGLVRYGEVVFCLEVDPGAVRLVQASSWDVEGSYDPATWIYRLELPGPSGSVSKRIGSAGVVHLRYASFPQTPWKGISPVSWAAKTGELAGNLETRMGQEAGGIVGSLLPVPTDGGSGGEDDPLSKLKADLRKLDGRTAAVETMAGGWGEGRQSAPKRDWQPSRIGANFPAGNVNLRGLVSQSILASCGVPPSLADSGSDGTGQRESWRRFLHGTLQPVAKIIRAEFREKLEIPELSFSFHELMASDLSGRARAFGSLTGTEENLTVDQAATICGFDLGSN